MVLFRTIVIRILIGLATLLAVATLIFLAVSALPGDAVTTALGAQSSNDQLVQQRRAELGLDRPILVQYASWLGGLAHGDLGHSLASGQPVSSLIIDKLTNTAVLALLIIVFLVPISFVLGLVSALRRDSLFDGAVQSSTLVLAATPEFVVGPLLVVLLTNSMGLFPGVALLDPSRSIWFQLNLLILPIMTVVLVVMAQATRMIRAAVSEVLQAPYVQQAVLRGTPKRVLIRRHVVPNSLGPTIQVLALTVAFLVGGIVVTESVFQFPGIGSTLVSAVGARDTTIVSALAVIISGVYIVANLLADIVIIALNPRLRRAVR